MNQILKLGGIATMAVVLVAGGIFIGLTASGSFTPDATLTYGPGMMSGSGMMDDQYVPGHTVAPGLMGGGMGMTGSGIGVMHGFAPGEDTVFGPGMMNEFGFGSDHSGMMGSFVPDAALVPATGETLALDEAVEVAEAYIGTFEDDDLELGEVMQFDNHFYGEAREESTGIGAFEFLIDAATAAVIPEFGPNMMWNVKYGHMGGGMMGRGRGMMGGIASGYAGEMSVTPDESLDLAQAYLDATLPGTTADDAEPFYGYYTLHTIGEDGEITGMLSVNGSTGEVWPHTWHGEFVDMAGADHD